MFLAYIASENSQGADSKAQGKERLSHGRKDNLLDLILGELAEIRQQIEFQSLRRTLQRTGAHSQKHHQRQQHHHHDLGDLFHTLLQTHGAHCETDDYDQDHPEDHLGHVRGKASECRTDSFRVKARKVAFHHFNKISQHPADDGGVEHHQQIIACHTEISVDMPFTALLFQYIEGRGNTLLAGSANCKFHDHDRQPQNDQKEQIDQNERRTAVLSRYVGKTPYISKTDGTTCRYQDKAQSGRKFFSFHFLNLIIFLSRIFSPPAEILYHNV